MGFATDSAHQRLGSLPQTFTYSQAQRLGGLSDRQLRRLLDEGVIEALSRGLYRRTAGSPEGNGAEPPDIDLLEIAARTPRATLCLTSALARHALTDAIPARIDIAIPRGNHRPALSAPVAWHTFDRPTFDIGRDQQPAGDGFRIGIYTAERSIIDAFRLSYLEGPELGIEALKRWLRLPGATASSLMSMARRFPKAERSLREALTILQ
jgi:predicted transcriptional regulator of viral defense system